jgi:hypothetical protein
MPTTAQLRAKANKAQAAAWEAERKERAKANRKLVGKTFKYRNSGGGDEQWWLYAKVQGAKDGNLLLFKFEQTPWGHQIEISNPRPRLTDGYVEIPAAEFKAAWRDTLSILNAVTA